MQVQKYMHEPTPCATSHSHNPVQGGAEQYSCSARPSHQSGRIWSIQRLHQGEPCMIAAACMINSSHSHCAVARMGTAKCTLQSFGAASSALCHVASSFLRSKLLCGHKRYCDQPRQVCASIVSTDNANQHSIPTSRLCSIDTAAALTAALSAALTNMDTGAVPCSTISMSETCRSATCNGKTFVRALLSSAAALQTRMRAAITTYSAPQESARVNAQACSEGTS